MKEIPLSYISNFQYGQTENIEGMTGCTVIICPKGAVASCSVRGGGPASHETELLKVTNTIEKIHAVVLSGGSAYGLEATAGVMKFLEERKIGFSVGGKIVPIVCGASIFDLNIGNSSIRPDKTMGYTACLEAEKKQELKNGNFGAGLGATVGKWLGMEFSMKSGIGSYAVQIGKLQLGAIVIVNALGDVLDLHSGKILAGLLSEDKKSMRSTKKFMYQHYSDSRNNIGENTSIACLVSNANLTKTEANRIANIANNAYAKVISPVHTSLDGDSIFMMSNGEVKVNSDTLATLAVDVLAVAINRAVMSATATKTLPSFQSLKEGNIS